MEQILKRILAGTTGWDQIYEKLAIRNEIEDTSVGKLFEQFCKYYYLAEPSVASDYKNVWLYEEAPREVKEKLNLAQNDHGVDIILEDMEGGYSVVQCKFRGNQDSRLSWSKDKIANLFAEADRADFIIVFTNASDIDEYSKGKQAEKFSLVTQGELVEIQPETIRKMVELVENKPVPVAPLRTPRPGDQVIAIEKVLAGFQNNDRGQLILPCGAGKTLVSLWVRERMDSKHTLVLVPSLALLRQTKNEWHSTQKKWQPYLCVCSEGDIDRGPDMPMVHTYEIGGRVTTDPNVIRDFLGRHERTTIYSTYQSLDAIIEAVKSTDFQFDLAICDEAHKTAGSKLGTFGNIHNNTLVPVKKRLYMTATPRIVSEQVKNRLGEEVTKYLADMGDLKTFGPEFHRMSFAEAIDKGILVDYQIIAIGVSDAELQSQLLDRQFAGDTETTIDDIANNYALEKVMEKHGATHAITFHSSVRRADQFKQRHQKLYADVFSGHVSGRQTTNERNVVMSQFKNSQKAVVTNARCLTEGVDVPAIDVVYFCDPKNSKIDIVQASGRALRTAVHKNKQIGHIVVPIFHKNEEKVEDTIEGSAFKNLITVVRALCDHDERLVDEITKIKVSKGVRQPAWKSAYTQIETACSLIVLEDFEEGLKKSIFDQVIEMTADSWTVMFELLKKFREEKPDVWPSASSDNINEKKLGVWCNTQRMQYRKGRLDGLRIHSLQDISFIWSPSRSEGWMAMFERLKKFRKRKPDIWPSASSENINEKKLGIWCNIQRMQHRKGKPNGLKFCLLEDIGFVWAPHEDNWSNNFKLLLEFRKLNPVRWPLQRSKEPVEHKLAVWILLIRKLYKDNQLDPERLRQLHEIGFPVSKFEYLWEKHYLIVKRWVDLQVKENIKTYKNINREAYQSCQQIEKWLLANRLDPNKKKLLEDIHFSDFLDRNDQVQSWDEKLNEVIEYYKISHKLPTNSKRGKSSPLALWLEKQRKHKNELTNEQVQKLEAMGMIWDTKQKKEEEWERHYKQLVEFRQNNRERWPSITSKDENERKLGFWCQHQRQRYWGRLKDYGSYPTERVQKLNQIGFDWGKEKSNAKMFDERLEELKEWLAKHRAYPRRHRRNADNEETSLSCWVINQRQDMKKGQLSNERIKKLNSINFMWDGRGKAE
jgi:superfamily II DNA or RNA helicase